MNYEYCDGITHTIKQGDTLYSISRLHKVPLGILLRANPYVDVYNLQIGDTICIPVKNNVCRPGMDCGRPNRPNRPNSRPDRDDDNDDDDDDDIYDRDDDDDRYDRDDDDDMYDRDDDDRYDRDDDDDRNRRRNSGGIRMSTNEVGRSAGLGIRTDRTGNDDRQDYDMNNGMGGNNGKSRVKYVSQSGDTLQDLFDRSSGGEEVFWQMNSPDRMYLLAGVAYHIIEE